MAFSYALDEFAAKTAEFWVKCAKDEGVQGAITAVTAAGMDGDMLYHILQIKTDQDTYEIVAGYEETEYPANVDEMVESAEMWAHILSQFDGTPEDMAELLEVEVDELQEAFFEETDDADAWNDLVTNIADYEFACVLEQFVQGAQKVGLSVADEVKLGIAQHDDYFEISKAEAEAQLVEAAREWGMDSKDAALFYATSDRQKWLAGFGSVS